MADFELWSSAAVLSRTFDEPTRWHPSWHIGRVTFKSIKVSLAQIILLFSFLTTPTPNAIFFCPIQAMENDELKLSDRRRFSARRTSSRGMFVAFQDGCVLRTIIDNMNTKTFHDLML
jgi:hypothetical protein